MSGRSTVKRRALWYVALCSVVAVAGACTPVGPGQPPATVRQLWVQRYAGAFGGDDEADSVAVSPNGRAVFVTGRSASSDLGFDAVTVAYRPGRGTPLWSDRYSDGAQVFPYDIAASSDNRRVFVTGQVYATKDSDSDAVTIAYDATTGARLWAQHFDGAAIGTNSLDYASQVDVSPDGSTVVIGGGTRDAAGKNEYLTVAYDAATGAERWVRQYQNGIDESASAIAFDPDGTKVFITGESSGAGTQQDYATVAYDATSGEQLWAARYDGSHGQDFASAVGVSPDGSTVFVTGLSYDRAGVDFATVAYGARDGDQRWATRYSGPASTGTSRARDLAVSPDGMTVFVTGPSDGLTGATTTDRADYATVAYATDTGAERWAARYDGPGNGTDDARGIAVAHDGSMVFVTGQSARTGTDWDYATITYDPVTGQQLAVTRYSGPVDGVNGAFDVAVHPSRPLIFVTGRSLGSSTFNDYDMATVAYRIR